MSENAFPHRWVSRFTFFLLLLLVGECADKRHKSEMIYHRIERRDRQRDSEGAQKQAISLSAVRKI